MSCPEFSGGNGLHKPTKHLNLSKAQLKEKNSQWYVGILSQQRFPQQFKQRALEFQTENTLISHA